MLSDEKISRLLKKIDGGIGDLQILFYELGFGVENELLPVPSHEIWQNRFKESPRRVAQEENSNFSVLWFPLYELDGNIQQRVGRHYSSVFSSFLCLFTDSTRQNWVFEIHTPSLNATCVISINHVNSTICRAFRALYLGDDERLTIIHLSRVAECFNKVGDSSNTPITYKAAWRPLTSEEEKNLAIQIENGGDEGIAARNKLILENRRLVYSRARSYLYSGMELDDLIQEGMIGLIYAVDKYDWRRGFRFSTYAIHWIRQAMGRAVENYARTIRLPSHAIESLSRIKRTYEVLSNKLSRVPTDEEIARAIDLPVNKVRRLLLPETLTPLSLNVPMGNSDTPLVDLLIADDNVSPFTYLFQLVIREEIDKALDCLTLREQEVLHLRFGLINDSDPMTLEEIGRKIGVSRERIRQIEEVALKKLRRSEIGGRLKDIVLNNWEKILDEEEVEWKKSVLHVSAVNLKKDLNPKKGKKYINTLYKVRSMQSYEKGNEIQIFGNPSDCQSKEKDNLISKLPVAKEISILNDEDKVAEIIHVRESGESEKSLFSSEKLEEIVAEIVTSECESCGEMNKTRPTLGGYYYRCSFCKHIGYV
jgi:RNA polymerase primary sigma factor